MIGGWTCQNQAGHGPGGAYCKHHARKHDKVKPKLELWSRDIIFFGSDDNVIPTRHAVREITDKTFIDDQGRRRALKDRYRQYYRTELEALAATRVFVTGQLRRAEAAAFEAKTVLKKLDAYQKKRRLT